MRPCLLQASVPMSDFSCGLRYSLCLSHSSCFRVAVNTGEGIFRPSWRSLPPTLSPWGLTTRPVVQRGETEHMLQSGG